MPKVSTALVRHLGYTTQRTWNAANQVILAHIRAAVQSEIVREPYDKEEKAFNRAMRRVDKMLARIERRGPTGY